MTVPATTRRAGPFNGNGVTTSFPFTFKVFSDEDILVTLASPLGVEAVQDLDTDYSVTVNIDQDSSPGGTVVMSVAPANGSALVVIGAIDYDQVLDLPGGGAFSPRALENSLDRTTMQVQQLVELADRTLTLPATVDGVSTQLPTPEADHLIGWNSTATALQNVDPQALVTIAAYGTTNADIFSGDGTTTQFELSDNPANVNNLDVSISGVSQRPGFDYTWGGGEIVTFTSAPPAGTSNILIRYAQALPEASTALPNPTGNEGKFLRSDGASSAWSASGGAEVVATEEAFPGITSADPAIATPAMQAFFAACRGKTGYIPAGDYFLNAPILHDPLDPIHIRGAGYDSDGRGTGTNLRWSTVCDGIQLIYSYAEWALGGGADGHTQYNKDNAITPIYGSSDNTVIIEDLALFGPGTTNAPGTQNLQLFEAGPQAVDSGNGIFMYWTVDAVIRNVWASGWPANGLRAFECFSSRVERCYFVGNRAAGMSLENQINAFTVDNVRCIGNGKVSGAFANFNCYIGGVRSNLGVSITNQCDFESAGLETNAGYSFTERDATITALTVTAGVATATFLTTPNFEVGHWIGVFGGTDTLGTSDINTTGQPNVVLSKTGNSITWATTAPDGNYLLGGRIHIGPYSCGLGLYNVYGAQVNFYSEGTTGPAVYVYQNSRAVTIAGSPINNSRLYGEAWYYGGGVSVAGGGAGYAVNDLLTLVGGTLRVGGTAAVLRVTSVLAGVITGVSFEDEGQYTVGPASPISVTGGTGAGATFNVLFAPLSANGLTIANNFFFGSNGGVYSESELGITLSNNQYFKVGDDDPKLYLGYVMAENSPLLQETNVPIVQGVPSGRGTNVFVGPKAPGHISNWGSGVNTFTNLQDQGNGNGTGRQNTAFGAFSGPSVSSGYNNTMYGYRAGFELTTGFNNVMVGSRCGENGPNLQDNVYIGFGSGRSVTAGGSDVFIGTAAGQYGTPNQSGGENIFVGRQAGRQGTGNPVLQSVILGAQTGSFTAPVSLTNYIAVGYNVQNDATYVPATNTTVIGTPSTVRSVIYGPLVTPPRTVASLPVAAAILKGARAFVTDANATAFYGVVAGGGANNVPVFCDGTAWRIG